MTKGQSTVAGLLAVIAVTLGPSSIVGGLPAAEVQPPCPWDCQAVPSGSVDVPDLLALLAVWNVPNTNICDFTGDGTANVPDLLKLLGLWGNCPP